MEEQDVGQKKIENNNGNNKESNNNKIEVLEVTSGNKNHWSKFHYILYNLKIDANILSVIDNRN